METPGSRWEKFRATAERAQQEGMYEFAETTWAAALDDAEDFGDTDRRLAYTLEKLSECLWTQGKLNDAANYCKRVLKIYEKVLGPDHADVACFAGNLAMIYHGRKEYDKAESYYKRALDIKRKFLPADHPELKNLPVTMLTCCTCWGARMTRQSSKPPPVKSQQQTGKKGQARTPLTQNRQYRQMPNPLPR
jgi:Tetratricopeptide repeat.